MNKQTDRRQRKSAGQYHMHRVKSRTARSRKKKAYCSIPITADVFLTAVKPACNSSAADHHYPPCTG